MEQNINEIISAYRELKESPFFPFEEFKNEPDSFKEDKRVGKERMEEIQRMISENKDQSFVYRHKNNVIHAIDILLHFTKKTKPVSHWIEIKGLL